MKYRFSKLCTINELENTVSVQAHVPASVIDLFEEAYVEEFRALRQNGGTNQIASELETALFEQKVLIPEDEEEISFLEDRIKEIDDCSYGLILLPTEECNLRCVYCYEKFNSSELTQAHYDLLAGEVGRALEHGKKNISISWFGGEPLLKLDDILLFNARIRDMSAEKGAAFSGAITTNGVLLGGDALNALCAHGVTVYQITLDGFLHDSQRVFPNGGGSFEIIWNNIRSMLESDLEFNLTLRVNVPAKDFDLSFYDLFLPYVNDKRILFYISSVNRWCEFDLPVLENGACAKRELERHKEYLKDLGLRLYEDEIRGILSDGCYAARPDLFTVRANGQVVKCTVALDDEGNDIGYLDLDKGAMVIDYNTEDLWSYNPLSSHCYNCGRLATCANRSCPLVKRKRTGADRCCIR